MRSVMKNSNLHIPKAAVQLLKIIVFAYILTGIFLLLLALIMFKMDLKQSQVDIGVTVIMILSTFIGGFLAAKAMKQRRFIYGSIIGVIYYVILIAISLGLKDATLTTTSLTNFVLCFGSGALGGMLG